MNQDFHFSYDFYPVGQGLFAAGFLSRSSVCEFAWVYDCGTTSGRALMNGAMDRFRDRLDTRSYIDLLVLSHFDRDHISGVCELLRSFKVRRLMLPYMPLAERLVLAFEEGIDATDPMIEFYLNPVGYLLGQDAREVGQVVFVPPSGDRGTEPQEGPGSADEPASDEDVQIQTDDELGNSEDGTALLDAGQHGSRSASVVFLRPGSVVKLPSWVWEFVPYNDDAPNAITGDFARDVALERGRLLSAGNEADREACLQELLKSYDAHFGSKPRKRNIISLFVYAGPLTGSQNRSWLDCALSWWQEPRPCLHCWPHGIARFWGFGGTSGTDALERCSVLYAGDGYLNTESRLKELTTYLGGKRMSQVGVFQVMHHGAKANWREGVATAIAPVFGVFCSDPEYQYKHPAADVVRDFWRFGPVQVDKTMGFTVEGWWQYAR